MKLQAHKAEDGKLYPLSLADLPFETKRVFIVRDVPKGERRGGHAHYVNKCYLFCMQGKIDAFLHDGSEERVYNLEEGDGVFVDNLIWDAQVYKTGKDILIAFCSLEYDPADYIEDFKKFKLLATK